MEKSTASLKFVKGMPLSIPNKIVSDKKEYHISYNNRDVALYGCSTTAIYINETSQFLILNGNHSENYNELESLKDCLDYFYKNIDQANPKSEHGTIFKIIEDKGKYIKGGY